MSDRIPFIRIGREFIFADTHSILKSKQGHLKLTDCRTIKIQLQFELRQGVCDYFSVCHPNEIPQTRHQRGDVLMLQFGLLGALQTDALFKTQPDDF